MNLQCASMSNSHPLTMTIFHISLPVKTSAGTGIDTVFNSLCTIADNVFKFLNATVCLLQAQRC